MINCALCNVEVPPERAHLQMVKDKDGIERGLVICSKCIEFLIRTGALVSQQGRKIIVEVHGDERRV